VTLQRYQIHKTPVAMDDGRTLNYYDYGPVGETPSYLGLHQSAARGYPAGPPRRLEHPPVMRWNPTLDEWTVYAANRMGRVQLPSKESCPLCPGILELPLPYQVAIFENRSPAMAYVYEDQPKPPSPDGLELTEWARGRCDLVAYSEQHNSKLAAMSLTDIYGLVEAWRDRYTDGQPGDSICLHL
jgi:hypothetical protein